MARLKKIATEQVVLKTVPLDPRYTIKESDYVIEEEPDGSMYYVYDDGRRIKAEFRW